MSYPRNGDKSVNANTPADLCKVNYPPFEEAIKICLGFGPSCYIAKSDLISAFRILGINPRFWRFLVMKAQSPLDQRIYYFFDKCMPFGSAISCANFQKVSDAISYLVSYRTGRPNINYLDDFFFAELLKLLCNNQVKTFMQICAEINFPVSIEKTFWGTTLMTFLGLLIDTARQVVLIPKDKIDKTLDLLQFVLNKRRIKLRCLQSLCGSLNFLCKCVVPGRAFTRRLYAADAHLTCQDHHLPVTEEMRLDLHVWHCFLKQPDVFCRPFIQFDDVTPFITDFHTDASGNPELGAGGHCNKEWFILQWDKTYFTNHSPSIDYLELYGLTVGLRLWLSKFQNQSIVVFCDNMGVVHMVNNNTSSCKRCMVLLRIIVLMALQFNVSISALHVPTRQNVFADLLSRLKYAKFRQEARRQRRFFNGAPTPIPDDMWPMEKLLPKFN